MTISRNRSLVVASAIANGKQFFMPHSKGDTDRWENEGGAVGLKNEGETPHQKGGTVIPWLQYAAKRIYRKKVAPDYAMLAYARKLKMASVSSQLTGKVA